MGIITKMFVAFLAYIIFAVSAIAEVPQSITTSISWAVVTYSILEYTDLSHALTERSNLTANMRTKVLGDSSALLGSSSTKLGRPPPQLPERYRQKQLSQ